MRMFLCRLLEFIFKMEKILYSLVFLGSNLFYCQNINPIIELYADLTYDNTEEKILIKELNDEGEFGKTRLLEIYKKVKTNWVVIASSKSAILSSESGGMMGDPFDEENITVKNGIITIIHNGGSSWKWSTTHKYRYQNKRFELIGYETTNGKPCNYWEDISYNLSTGKVIYTRENDICEDYESEYHKDGNKEEIFIFKLKKLPTIENINILDYKITCPKYKATFQF